MRSPNSTRVPTATKIGDVVTSTTLAAMVVLDSEEIHSAKCAARIAPASRASAICVLESPLTSDRRRTSIGGTTSPAEMAFR